MLNILFIICKGKFYEVLDLIIFGLLVFSSSLVSVDRFYNVGYKIIDLPCNIVSSKTKKITVAMWYPTEEMPKKYMYGGVSEGYVAYDAKPLERKEKYPLLVFSHGYGGSGISAVFLTEALASRGWIVVAPDHNDKTVVGRIKTGYKRFFNPFPLFNDTKEILSSGPKARKKYLYRIDELEYVLNWVVNSEFIGRLIDTNKIAVSGYSFGGFGALGLCGTIKDRYDKRIKAVLIFSTGGGGYLYDESELALVNIPSMYFLGETERNKKRGEKTMGELAVKVFSNIKPPKYFLELKGANHYTFNQWITNSNCSWFLSGTEEQFNVIKRYSIAFLEKYVLNKDDTEKILDTKDEHITRYLKEVPG